jgi:FkbH-like protein
MIRASLGLTSKCLALDLDNTLWGGIIGEDGINGIRLGGGAAGESYVAFQEYVLALQRRGVILAICSKNNEQDAKAPFQDHPEMVLKLDDIAVFAADWQSKDENLRHIATTLNIGLDSIVFIDDNPVERNLIRSTIPEVEVIELPQDPANYSAALHRSLCFEAWTLTDDDRRRATSYQQNAKRSEQLARDRQRRRLSLQFGDARRTAPVRRSQSGPHRAAHQQDQSVQPHHPAASRRLNASP